MVAAAISSSVTPINPAKVWAVRVTNAGSFRLPRSGAGASQGASVSTSTASSGILRRHVAQRLSLGIGQIPGERNQKTQIERTPRLLPVAAEAVHHAAEAGWPPMVFQNGEKIVPGIGGLVAFRPAMDEDRPLAGGGNLQLLDEASRWMSCGAPSW